ncbi:MAG: AraC family transcriptional regulator, partial [Mesorhizobium sp.]
MSHDLGSQAFEGLGRLCADAAENCIISAPDPAGMERIEARFHGSAFDPHRHDTYAIGVTLRGVQTFRYRGAARLSLPGQVIVLHPDELHDGGAGTEEG